MTFRSTRNYSYFPDQIIFLFFQKIRSDPGNWMAFTLPQLLQRLPTTAQNRTTIGTSFRSNSSNLTELNKSYASTHGCTMNRFQEAVCRAIKRSVQATTATTTKTQKASPLRNRLVIESAIVRWKIDQSRASVDRTRLRPLSESAMTFGPFMAWNKSRLPLALIHVYRLSRFHASISLSYRRRASQVPLLLIGFD